MSVHEMSILYRVMSKGELFNAIKKTSKLIIDNGGFIRKIENLGTQDMAYKISAHGVPNRKASIFVIKFSSPLHKLKHFVEENRRDVDIIRSTIIKEQEPEKFECTLEAEIQPPPYRESVQQLIYLAKKASKVKPFVSNSGLDYFPFQK